MTLFALDCYFRCTCIITAIYLKLIKIMAKCSKLVATYLLYSKRERSEIRSEFWNLLIRVPIPRLIISWAMLSLSLSLKSLGVFECDIWWYPCRKSKTLIGPSLFNDGHFYNGQFSQDVPCILCWRHYQWPGSRCDHQTSGCIRHKIIQVENILLVHNKLIIIQFL